MNKLLILASFIFTFLNLKVEGQSLQNWDAFSHGDFKKSKLGFQNDLKLDSSRESALQGLIFISDLHQDYVAYDTLVDLLLEEFPKEVYFNAFLDDFRYENQELPEHFSYFKVEREKAKQRAKRDLTAVLNTSTAYFPNFQWEYLGPFKNINGSSYIEEEVPLHEIEDTKSYPSGFGYDIDWFRPKHQNMEGVLRFEYHLKTVTGGGAYYARTSFESLNDETYTFKISRNSPIKIWLDKELVFDQKDPVNYLMNMESVQVKIPKGEHLLSVKVTPYKSIEQYSPFMNFNNMNVNAFLFPNVFQSTDVYGGQGDPELSALIRITDKNNKVTIKSKEKLGLLGEGVELISKEVFNVYLNGLNEQDLSPFNLYLIQQTYCQVGKTRELEAVLLNNYDELKDKVFYKFLLARTQANNGKLEIAYSTLSNIDVEKSTIFAMVYDKLQELDFETSKDKYDYYLSLLEEITPNSYRILKKRGQFIKNDQPLDSLREYVKSKSLLYPEHTARLSSALLDEEIEDRVSDKKSEKKHQKKMVKTLKKSFDLQALNTTLNYYKRKNKQEKIFHLYDELLENYPYYPNYYDRYAYYLISIDENEKAMKILDEGMKVSFQNNDLIETKLSILEGTEKIPFLENKLIQTTSANEIINIATELRRLKKENNWDLYFEKDSLVNTNTYSSEDAIINKFVRQLLLDEYRIARLKTEFEVTINTNSGLKDFIEYDYSFMGNLTSIKAIKPDGTEILPDKSGSYAVFKSLEVGDKIYAQGFYEWVTISEFGDGLVLPTYLSFYHTVEYAKIEVLDLNKGPFHYNVHLLEDNLLKEESDNGIRYTWLYKDVPPVKNNTSTREVLDNFSYIDISTVESWETISNWYQAKAYRKITLPDEFKIRIDSICQGVNSSNEKVRLIYNYLTKSINYSFVPFLNSGFVPKNTDLTLETKIGDCKDVSTIMISALKYLGIEAKYCLVRTNASGYQDPLPSMIFDHVIVQYEIDGEDHFLDMTTDFYPYSSIPSNNSKAMSMVIEKGKAEINLLPDPVISIKNRVNVFHTAELLESNSLKIHSKIVLTNEQAGEWREVINTLNKEDEENYIKKTFLNNFEFEFDSLQIHHKDSIDMDLIIELNYVLTHHFDEISGLKIFSYPFFNLIQKVEAFNSKDRNVMFDLNKERVVYPIHEEMKLLIPKNMKFYKFPEDISENGKFGRYNVRFEKERNGVKVIRDLSFEKTYIEPSEFEDFKSFYMNLINWDNQKSVLINR